MKFKSFLFAVLLTAITLSSCGDGNKMTSKAEKLSPENQSTIDSLSYVFGNQIGSFMQGYGGNFNIELFRKGLDDVANDMEDSLKMVPMDREIHDRLFGAFNAMQLEMMQKTNLQEANDFLAENGKKEGVITTASGLQYEVLTEGEGATPTIDESVTVNYHGTFSNGEVFDSSVDRNEPATFPINGVIPGWTEALQLMKKGSKYRLVIPPNLAYGENGKRNPMSGEFGIEPNELLVFEVEMLEILPAAAPEAAPVVE